MWRSAPRVGELGLVSPRRSRKSRWWAHDTSPGHVLERSLVRKPRVVERDGREGRREEELHPVEFSRVEPVVYTEAIEGSDWK